MPRLNRTLVDKLEPPESGRIQIMDAEQPNFGVRVSAAGVKTFIARVRIGKGRAAAVKTVTLGRHPTMTAEKARQGARDLLATARLGNDPSPKINTRTVEDLVMEWIDGPGKRTRKGRLKSDHSFNSDCGRLLNHVVPVLGKVRVRELTRSDVERLRDTVVEGKTAKEKVKTSKHGVSHVRGGAGCATHVMITFSTLLGWAVEREYIERNVALGVHQPETKRCERFLTIEEAKHLLTTMDQGEYNPIAIIILKLLLVTGRRYSEIAAVKWENLDLIRGILVLQRSKTGAHPTYLSKTAIDLFRQAPVQQSEWVFPTNKGHNHYTGTPRVWSKVLKASKLPKTRIHDLRHSFASLALADGASLEQIGELLLHKERRTTMIYAHFVPGAVKAVADRVGNILMSPGQPKSPDGPAPEASI